MGDFGWAGDWAVEVHLWVERHGQAVLGEGRAELLSAVGRTKSITAAAKAIGMSYRRAWSLIQEVNAAAGEALVESAVGGVKGGGARLTDRGQFAVELYEQLRAEVRGTAAGILHRLVAADDSANCVHLAAAISLQEAVGQLLTDYALHQPAIRVRAVFGASNELADHVLSGAPADLFLTADAIHLDRLESAGLIVPNSRRSFAANALAAVAASGHAPAVHAPKDLAIRAVKHIALAEPASPLGKCSQAYLRAIGLYDALLPKVVHVDNSRAVVAAVQAGTAEVGLVMTSDAATARECQTLFHVPPSRARVEYAAAVVRCGRRPVEAGALLAFLTSKKAGRCFRRCGLRPVAKPKSRIERLG